MTPPARRPTKTNDWPTGLLERMKNPDDRESWREFLDLYGHLIHRAAAKAGMTDPQTQDVVQETIISVSRHIRDLDDGPARGSFRAWLLVIIRWSIIKCFRRRAS